MDHPTTFSGILYIPFESFEPWILLKGPDSQLRRFYQWNPEAPESCEACGEHRVLEVAHKPSHPRLGQRRSRANMQWPEAVWVLCPIHQTIDVIVHPQSIIHSLVQFTDGSIKAQMGLPDMKLPIQYALTYPYRFPSKLARFNFMDYPNLTFEKPDLETFKNLKLAYEALEKGGNLACILNASNEVAVDAFLHDKIKFLQIADINEQCMNGVKFVKNPSYEDFVTTDLETRKFAESLI